MVDPRCELADGGDRALLIDHHLRGGRVQMVRHIVVVRLPDCKERRHVRIVRVRQRGVCRAVVFRHARERRGDRVVALALRAVGSRGDQKRALGDDELPRCDRAGRIHPDACARYGAKAVGGRRRLWDGFREAGLGEDAFLQPRVEDALRRAAFERGRRVREGREDEPFCRSWGGAACGPPADGLVYTPVLFLAFLALVIGTEW